MERAIAKIKKDDQFETIEGGLESYDQENLFFVLGDGTKRTINKDDVEALQITNKLFYLDGQEQPEEVEEIYEEKKPFTIAPAGEKRKKGDGNISFKLQQCVDIVKANPTAKRKDIIAAIMKKVGMSEPGASTYHQMAKKHLGL